MTNIQLYTNATTLYIKENRQKFEDNEIKVAEVSIEFFFLTLQLHFKHYLDFLQKIIHFLKKILLFDRFKYPGDTLKIYIS